MPGHRARAWSLRKTIHDAIRAWSPTRKAPVKRTLIDAPIAMAASQERYRRDEGSSVHHTRLTSAAPQSARKTDSERTILNRPCTTGSTPKTIVTAPAVVG